MPLENRSNSATYKRAEQLKRWENSATNLQEIELKVTSRKIKFSLGCVFLAACAAGDKEEVLRLLEDGADIDTANVDGLTALHQACIDNNLDMVEFLVTHGADVNRGDNEGWTPLHATASCGFVSIAKYLIENGAHVAAVNNDGELPLDVADGNNMEILDLLQEIIDAEGIDCEEARNREETMMLQDAKDWLNGGGDLIDPLQPHPKTGATALHVAAAKGYIKVMSILLQGQADVDAQDFDGWTPLHAAAHWGQKEAAEMLVENFCNMDLKNYAEQTAVDVADAKIVKVLEDLRVKQAALQKDRPPPNNLSNKALTSPKRRSSITRMSGAEKSSLINKDASSEREILDRTMSEEPSNKVKKVELEIETEPEKEEVGSISEESNVDEEGDDDDDDDDDVDVDDDESWSEDSSEFSVSYGAELELSGEEKNSRANMDEPIRIPSLPDLNKTALSAQSPLEEESPWRRPGSFRNKHTIEQSSLNLEKKGSPNKSSIFSSEVALRRTHSFEADEKFYRRYLELQARIASSCPALHPPAGQSLLRLPTRSASLRERQASRRGVKEETSGNVEPTTTSAATTPTSKTSVVTSQNTPTSRTVSSPTLISQPSVGSGPLKLTMTPPTPQTPTLSTPTTPTTPGGSKLSPGNIFKNFFKSFVPPVRDEESETQRKAHAKRVRETRRSTQGVTLEEIKSAEQLVKKKNQQASNNNDQTITPAVSATATITAAPSSPNAVAKDEETSHERRPSWRLKLDNNNKFLLEDARSKTSSTTDTDSVYIRRSSTGNSNALTAANSLPADSSGEATVTLSLRRQGKVEDKEDKENDSRSALATQAVIQRRRKPKRRSTGVVHVDMDEIDPDRQDSGGAGDSESNKLLSDGRNIGSGSTPRRSAGVSSIRSNNRPRSGYYSSGGSNGYSGLSSVYNSGNSYGHGYGASSYGGSSLGSYHSSSYPNYGGAYSTYGGTSSGYGSLHLPPSSTLSGSPSSSYLSSSPSSSFKHLTPGGYSKPVARSPAKSNMGSRSGSTSSLLSLKSEGSEGYASDDKSGRSSRLSSVSSTGLNDDSAKMKSAEATENGEIDYKKLYEESLAQNERLKDKLKKTEDELTDARNKIEKHINMDKSSLSELEKRERRALERKLSEMEEELKQLQKLKAENERLKAENRALTRVVSKLTNSAQK